MVERPERLFQVHVVAPRVHLPQVEVVGAQPLE
jgi:hypothetical protein